MVKILCIDPGIINIGVCLVDKDKFEGIINTDCVIFWDVINLLEKDGVKKCFECSKFSGTYSDNINVYCKKHSKNKKNIKKVNKLTSTSISYSNLVIKIKEFVVCMKDICNDIDIIRIESQRKSTEKIKFTSACLMTLFMELFPLSDVDFMDGRLKLKVYQDNKIFHNTPTQRYKKNKFLGIQHCQEFIKEDTELVEKFKGFKKKDDSADAMLMCIFNLKSNY
jgi:hypothetical protein